MGWREWVARNIITDNPMDDEAIRWEARTAWQEPWFSVSGSEILAALREVANGADPDEVYVRMKENINAGQ